MAANTSRCACSKHAPGREREYRVRRGWRVSRGGVAGHSGLQCRETWGSPGQLAEQPCPARGEESTLGEKRCCAACRSDRGGARLLRPTESASQASVIRRLRASVPQPSPLFFFRPGCLAWKVRPSRMELSSISLENSWYPVPLETRVDSPGSEVMVWCVSSPATKSGGARSTPSMASTLSS
eukprot:scaffold23186_cov112-Isochrysis_galbana.AAC.9